MRTYLIQVTGVLRMIKKENNWILHTEYELFDLVIPLLKTVLC